MIPLRCPSLAGALMTTAWVVACLRNSGGSTQLRRKPRSYGISFENGLKMRGGGGDERRVSGLPILSPLRPVLRCNIGGTNSYDCPNPTLSGKCGNGLTCSYLPPSPPPP
eukprot:scaffold31513_cov30-Phaeocystis_antarctica.AAC.2